MPRYQYDVSISSQKRFIRRFKKILIVVVCGGVLVGIVIIGDAFRQSIQGNTDIGSPSTSVVRPVIREFDTGYFTFTASTGWTNIAAETTNQKYVYRSYRGSLIEQELIIYVNNPNIDLSATYVLPVRVQDGKRIIPTEVSDHCNTASSVKLSSRPVEVTIKDTKMLCQLDGTNYLVVVGEKGGSTSLKLDRNGKSSATYSFLYRSSTTPPDTIQLVTILNSFVPL